MSLKSGVISNIKMQNKQNISWSYVCTTLIFILTSKKIASTLVAIVYKHIDSRHL